MTHNLIRKLLIIGLCSLFSAAASAQTFIFTAIPDEDETKLVERFRGSRFQTVSELLEAATGEEPKVNGKPVCLTWALKGSCSAKCKRGKQHTRYPPAVIKKIHHFLTDAGVAPSVE